MPRGKPNVYKDSHGYEYRLSKKAAMVKKLENQLKRLLADHKKLYKRWVKERIDKC